MQIAATIASNPDATLLGVGQRVEFQLAIGTLDIEAANVRGRRTVDVHLGYRG